MSWESFPYTACAVCGHVLNRYSSAFGETWVHALEEDKDHPAVPVPAESIHTINLCDFCLASDAAWVLPAETYYVGRENRSMGDWQCCAECAALLERNDWDVLAQRALIAAQRRTPHEDFQVEVFEAMYRQLRLHVTGPVRLAQRGFSNPNEK